MVVLPLWWLFMCLQILEACMNFYARLIALEKVDASLAASFSLNLLEGYSLEICALKVNL